MTQGPSGWEKVGEGCLASWEMLIPSVSIIFKYIYTYIYKVIISIVFPPKCKQPESLWGTSRGHMGVRVPSRCPCAFPRGSRSGDPESRVLQPLKSQLVTDGGRDADVNKGLG